MKMMLRSCLVGVTALLLANVAMAQDEPPTLVVIKSGKLIDTENARVLSDQEILIENDAIKASGTWSSGV